MTTTTYAATIATVAIDVVHGCHLNAERASRHFGTALEFLTGAAEEMNADPDVVSSVGLMPVPVGIAEDGPDGTTVAYADGSAIRFAWDGDGLATSMAVLPSVGAEAEATYY